LLIGLTNAKAEDNAIYLEKNQPAPFTGILFTETLAKNLRSDLLEGDKNKLQLHSERLKSSNLMQIIKLKDTELEAFQRQNQRLLKQEQTSQTMQYVWFGLGILATGAAVYGAGALSR